MANDNITLIDSHIIKYTCWLHDEPATHSRLQWSGSSYRIPICRDCADKDNKIQIIEVNILGEEKDGREIIEPENKRNS